MRLAELQTLDEKCEKQAEDSIGMKLDKIIEEKQRKILEIEADIASIGLRLKENTLIIDSQRQRNFEKVVGVQLEIIVREKERLGLKIEEEKDRLRKILEYKETFTEAIAKDTELYESYLTEGNQYGDISAAMHSNLKSNEKSYWQLIERKTLIEDSIRHTELVSKRYMEHISQDLRLLLDQNRLYRDKLREQMEVIGEQRGRMGEVEGMFWGKDSQKTRILTSGNKGGVNGEVEYVPSKRTGTKDEINVQPVMKEKGPGGVDRPPSMQSIRSVSSRMSQELVQNRVEAKTIPNRYSSNSTDIGKKSTVQAIPGLQ